MGALAAPMDALAASRPGPGWDTRDSDARDSDVCAETFDDGPAAAAAAAARAGRGGGGRAVMVGQRLGWLRAVRDSDGYAHPGTRIASRLG